MLLDHVGHMHDQVVHVEVDVLTGKNIGDGFGECDAHLSNLLGLLDEVLLVIDLNDKASHDDNHKLKSETKRCLKQQKRT
jgi:hypothetical protein